ncbi:putative chromatin remodeling complex subunit [Protomyces lactucae-debilis]|uniref:Putative chromatin remodeling complex subunit n=1 Tax=Protomyces lactucae-debilis TaxID=2754530 RepID=A0A1Y2FS28_PROLT|nr:putative chromatin remodeling complex subunit [Protomyces lactucae-debilis]ORY86793.1 putative chromatin remodeling complex subunit [Protomyces lactucae-debilis]
MIYDLPADPAYPATFAGADTPIIIDNGTHHVRAGYANATSPHLDILNLSSKTRIKKANDYVVLAGHDCVLDTSSRSSARSPYDGSIITNWDSMETILDYTFLKLGLAGQETTNPIVMTETICNLPASRKQMNELLFECYGAPSVAYGIDHLFSFHENGGHSGIVIGSGHQATHVLPVLQGKPLLEHCKRLSLGGLSVSSFLLRLLQLKYPNFPIKVTAAQAAQMVKDHTYVSTDYDNELKSFLGSCLTEKDIGIQFPYVDTTEPEKTAEELAAIAQRRIESGQRLQQAAAAKRLEKLVQAEQDLDAYLELKKIGKSLTKKDFLLRLQSEMMDSEQILDTRIAVLEERIKRARNKDLGVVEEEVKEAPDFSLVDVPDAQLDEAGIKAKRGQRLLKYSYDARQRAKAEKQAQRERDEADRLADIAKRERDLGEWVAGKRRQRQVLLDRIKDRKKLKAELQDRKSLASQMRMKSIAGLAANPEAGPATKRKRKNDDDDFGMDDGDWHVYRDIANESDNEEEEEEIKTVRQLETELLEYDGTFTEQDTLDAKADPSKSLLHAFLHGPYNAETVGTLPAAHQLHLNIERIRAPEMLFKPSLVGLDQGGIIEVASGVVSRLPQSSRSSIVQEFFTTGGNSLIRGFNDRLRVDLRAILPAEQKFTVKAARDPLLDAWRGAAKWASGAKWKQSSVTRAEYMEMGSDYMKEHDLGNVSL